jgi:hypothetical protein
MAHKVILPPKKNYIPQFLKQRDINSYSYGIVILCHIYPTSAPYLVSRSLHPVPRIYISPRISYLLSNSSHFHNGHPLHLVIVNTFCEKAKNFPLLAQRRIQYKSFASSVCTDCLSLVSNLKETGSRDRIHIFLHFPSG